MAWLLRCRTPKSKARSKPTAVMKAAQVHAGLRFPKDGTFSRCKSSADDDKGTILITCGEIGPSTVTDIVREV